MTNPLIKYGVKKLGRALDKSKKAQIVIERVSEKTGKPLKPKTITVTNQNYKSKLSGKEFKDGKITKIIRIDDKKTPRGSKPVKEYEREAARKDPETGGSVDAGRSVDYDVSEGRMKLTQGANKKRGFIQEQTTKADITRGKTKAELSAMSKDSNLTDAQRKEAKTAYDKMVAKDKADTARRNIRISQTARKDKKVSLAETSAERKAKKPADVPKEFFDEETGEVFGISTSRWNSLTPRQKNQMLENFKARARTGEDLSDKAMAKRNIGKAAAGMYEGRSRVKAPRGVRTEEYKRGGKIGKSKPRGVGAAQRGYGKAMKGNK